MVQIQKKKLFIVPPSPKPKEINPGTADKNKREIQPIINQGITNNDTTIPCKSMWKRKIHPAICTFGRVCKRICMVIGNFIDHTLAIVAGLITGAAVAASLLAPTFIVLCLAAPPIVILINFLPIIIPICAFGAVIGACSFENELLAQIESDVRDIIIEREKKVRKQKRTQIENKIENKITSQKDIKKENKVIKKKTIMNRPTIIRRKYKSRAIAKHIQPSLLLKYIT